MPRCGDPAAGRRHDPRSARRCCASRAGRFGLPACNTPPRDSAPSTAVSGVAGALVAGRRWPPAGRRGRPRRRNGPPLVAQNPAMAAAGADRPRTERASGGRVQASGFVPPARRGRRPCTRLAELGLLRRRARQSNRPQTVLPRSRAATASSPRATGRDQLSCLRSTLPPSPVLRSRSKLRQRRRVSLDGDACGEP
jgi:hypothetical protein